MISFTNLFCPAHPIDVDNQISCPKNVLVEGSAMQSVAHRESLSADCHRRARLVNGLGLNALRKGQQMSWPTIDRLVKMAAVSELEDEFTVPGGPTPLARLEASTPLMINF
jgi:hypothetical protein